MTPKPLDANELFELRGGILRELYRVHPNGRTDAKLAWLLNQERQKAGGDAIFTPENVGSNAAFLEGKQQVVSRQDNDLSPGMDPVRFITAGGMAYVEKNKLI